jgi:hypothetical protein
MLLIPVVVTVIFQIFHSVGLEELRLVIAYVETHQPADRIYLDRDGKAQFSAYAPRGYIPASYSLSNYRLGALSMRAGTKRKAELSEIKANQLSEM